MIRIQIGQSNGINPAVFKYSKYKYITWDHEPYIDQQYTQSQSNIYNYKYIQLPYTIDNQQLRQALYQVLYQIGQQNRVEQIINRK